MPEPINPVEENIILDDGKNEIATNEVVETARSSTDKDRAENMVVKEETVRDTEEKVEPETKITDIVNFIETLPSAPTHIPKNFSDQIKIYNNTLYVYDTVNDNWIAL